LLVRAMIAGVVLAGGQAKRVGGGDKPLLPLLGATVLDHVVARVRPQVAVLGLSANGDAARFARFGLPVLPDTVAAAGPLAGVLAGLRWASGLGARALLTVPGDAPFLPDDLVARLGEAPAWAASEGSLHPLVAVWPMGVASTLAVWLVADDKRRVRDFGRLIGMRTVEFVPGASGSARFFNINTVADLAMAEAIAENARPLLRAQGDEGVSG
jgi:molybdopterin-guanine dinucleotide biosynthesis protein A